MFLIDLRGAPVEAWLARYDPDLSEAEARRAVPDGFTGPAGGLIVVTKDPKLAKQFTSAMAVLKEWKRISSRQPWRLDGEPNRPLSAFTISPLEIPK